MQRAMDLAIVIVSYNTCQLTVNCLASAYEDLARCNLQGHIWVVDNASADGSADRIAADFSQATLIRNEQNMGFAAATNLALEHIRRQPESPRHVLLLNPDTIVCPNALKHMVCFLDTHPRVGVVGAQLTYGDGRFQHGAFRFPTLWMTFFDFWNINHRLLGSRLNGRYPRRLYEAGQPFAIDHPLGAAMMVRWDVIEEVGPLDTGYFMYCEEIDWCLRIKRAGREIYCVPQARIVHLAGQSTQQFRDEMFIALWRSRYRLFEKHYSLWYRRASRFIVRAGLKWRMKQLRQERAHGNIPLAEAERRLAAYRTVMEM